MKYTDIPADDPEALELAATLVEIGGCSQETALKDARKMLARDRGQKARDAERFRAAQERRARPPADHEDAYWRHHQSAPHQQGSKEHKDWLKANPWFEYQGKRWRRFTRPMRSNSGKNVMDWNPYFVAEDGSKVGADDIAPLNRRNDPDRNWGLPE